MILAWMTFAMLIGALVALAGVVVETLFMAGKRPVRFVWSGAIALTIVLALAAPLRRTDAVHATNVSAISLPEATSAATQRSVIHIVQQDARAMLDVITSPVAGALSLVQNISASHARVLIAIWIVASTAALLMLIAVYIRFASRRKRWPAMRLFGSPVRVAPDEGPAVMGIAPPEIVIPQWVLSRDSTEQQLVIAHESEHVRARDPMLLLLGCIAVALMPWNASLWFMWSRLRLAVELDCDNRVLQQGVRKPAYGQLLLELSEQRALLSPIMPAFAFGTSHLEQRLVAMTSRPSRHHVTRRIASGAVVTAALLAACNSELPTASQIEKMDVAAVETRVATSNATEYIVDGRAVTRSDANAIAPEKIASISVVRAPKGASAATINIKTRKDSSVKYMGDTVVSHTIGNNGSRIRIRGDSAIHMGAPLVYIDGKVSTVEFDTLDPKNIESIEVIKGATARAMYGERAANGVIVITTKHVKPE